LTQFSRRAALHLVGGGVLGALPFSRASAQASGAEAEWPTVTALVDRYVTQRKVAGMVAALGRGSAAAGFIARGREGFDDRDRIGPDSLFRAYSQTKPVTGMAAMILIDEGKLKLDQPLADFVPEFANPMVAIDPAKSLDSRPAKTQITIRHLLTHSSGMSYAGVGGNKVADELKRQGLTAGIFSRMTIPGVNDGPPTPGPDEFLRRAATVPLAFEPGTRWHYSMSLDVLGLVIARASGARSFGEFLAERIFAPAGMGKTAFQVSSGDVGRLTTNYGMLGPVLLPIDRPGKSIYRSAPPFHFGGSGLVTTPAEFDRFLGMIVNGGMVGSKRVMSEAAVRLGTSNLLPSGVDKTGTWVAGYDFGAGGLVGTGARAGVYGWSGGAGTIGLANTRLGLRTGLYVQYSPQDRYPLLQEFPAAILADMTRRTPA
jgi:CubicO group peptidase (beta-lactamase class C family)